MFKPVLVASTAALAIAAISVGASAQQPTTTFSPAQLTCANIAELEAAHSAALVYYIAGWTDAQAGDMQAQAQDAQAQGAVGGLTLSAAAVIRMCLAQPEALITEIIGAQGGSGVLSAPAGMPTAPTADPEQPQPAPQQ